MNKSHVKNQIIYFDVNLNRIYFEKRPSSCDTLYVPSKRNLFQEKAKAKAIQRFEMLVAVFFFKAYLFHATFEIAPIDKKSLHKMLVAYKYDKLFSFWNILTSHVFRYASIVHLITLRKFSFLLFRLKSYGVPSAIHSGLKSF